METKQYMVVLHDGVDYNQFCPVDFDHAFGTIGLSAAGVVSWGLASSAVSSTLYLDGAQFSLRIYQDKELTFRRSDRGVQSGTK